MLSAVKSTQKRNPDDFIVTLLMAVTGLRLEEASDLKVGNTFDKDGVLWVQVVRSKTKSGVRRVPVLHPLVLEQLRPLIKNKHSHEYVFKYLTGEEGKRSALLSKRLASLLRKISKDTLLVAGHSWRHRVRTQLERGDIKPWVADWFVGHKRDGEGLGRYSEGPSDAQLLTAAGVITLPQKV